MKQVVLEQTKLVRLLVYGESGSGKTTLMGSFHADERSAPLLVLNCGGQPISLRFLDPPPLVLTIERTEDLNPPYNWFLDGQPWEHITEMLDKGETPSNTRIYGFYEAVHAYFGGEPGRFGTIAIDSITHLQQTAARQIAKQDALPGNVPKPVQLQHWGQIRAQTSNIADVFFKLPSVHVVVTALTDHKYIEAYGRTEYSPLLNTKSAMEVPSHAEIVGRLMNVTALSARDKRTAQQQNPNAFCVLRTRGDADFAAKWQGVREPPAALFNPTASDLLDVIERADSAKGGFYASLQS